MRCCARSSRAHQRRRQLLDAQEQRFDQLRDLERAAPACSPRCPPPSRRFGPGCPPLSRSRPPARRRTRPPRRRRRRQPGGGRQGPRCGGRRGARGARGRRHQASEGVVALRRAQEAMARATQLIDAVERLAAGLDDAAARLPASWRRGRSDVAAARDGRRSPRRGPRLAARRRPGSRRRGRIRPPRCAPPRPPLGEARRAAEARPLDPLAALQRAARPTRPPTRRRPGRRCARQLPAPALADAAIATAQGHVTRAVDYITTRRHGVGRDARTRAAEAESRLERGPSARGDEPRGRDRDGQPRQAARRRGVPPGRGRVRRAGTAGSGPVAGPYRPSGERTPTSSAPSSAGSSAP